MRFVFAILAFLLAGSAHAQNYARVNAPSGGNIVGFNGPDGVYNNIFKQASISAGQQGYPAILDVNGYPNNGTLTTNLSMSLSLPWNYCGAVTSWVLDWNATTGGTNASPLGFIGGPGAFNPPPGRISVISGSQFVSTNDSTQIQMDFFGATAGAGAYGGTGGRIVFNWNNCASNPSAAIAGIGIPAGFFPGTWSGLKNFRLFRCDIAASCNAAVALMDAGGPEAYGGIGQKFINSIILTHPGHSRFLGIVGESNVQNALTKFAYRRPVDSLSFTTTHWLPSQWAGSITVTGGNTLAATLNGQSLSDGLLVQGYLSAATTSTAPCLALNGGTCFPAIGEGGGALSSFTASISSGNGASCAASTGSSGTTGTCMVVTAVSNGTLVVGAMVYGQGVLPGTAIVSQASGSAGGVGNYVVSQSLNLTTATNTAGINTTIAQNAYVQFTWDAPLQVWEYSPPGGNFNMDFAPIEVMADICNAINTNCWYNIPGFLVHDGSIGQIAQTFLNRLNGQLSFEPEFCNEVWNFAYSCTGYSEIYGQSVLGVTVAGDETIHSYYGVKFKTFMDEIHATIGANNPRVKGIMAAQYYAGAWWPFESLRFLGEFLCGTSCGNATYAANANAICGQATCDFNTSPNRPADAMTYVAGAPYTQGNEVNYSTQSPYISGFFQTATNNFASLAAAADQWAAGDTTDSYNYITNDLTGAANGCGTNACILPGEPTVFALQNPFQSGVNAGNGTFQIASVGTFTGNTTGASTTMVVTGLAGNPFIPGLLPKIYADPVNGTALSTNNNTFAATIVAQQSGTPGGNGTYTLSTPLTLSNTTIHFSGSWTSNWEQVAEDLSSTTGKTIKFLAYEGGWQLTGPTISNCNSIPAGSLHNNPKYYCFNSNPANPNGNVLVSGYKVGDVLSSTANSLTNFNFIIDTVGPDGTPLTGHIDPSHPGSGMTANATNVLLSGGSGFNIAADIAESGGVPTSVTLYSQVIMEMIYDYMIRSPQFATVTSALYNEIMAMPSSVGIAQSNYSGGTPNSNPWSLYYGVLDGGTQLQSWKSFKTINGGFLLNRDLDPASNDNSPVGLDRAA